MTNKEYLFTLSNEDLAKWALQRHPDLNIASAEEVASIWSNSIAGLAEWFNQEYMNRKER